jgi:hypothetical protein
MRGVIVSLLVAGVAACGGGQKPADDLIFDVRGYQEGLRWRRYEDSAARLKPSVRESFLDQREELDDELRVDDYEIIRVKLAAKGGKGGKREKATVLVKVTWHLDSVGIVNDTTVEQSWERHKAGWILVGEKRRRGDEMPGLPAGDQAKADAAPLDDSDEGSEGTEGENDSDSEGLGR